MTDSTIKKDDSMNDKWSEVAKKVEDENLTEAVSDLVEEAVMDPALLALQNLLEQSELKADENWQKYLLVHAEMDNLRRRTEQDIANAHKYALEKLARDVLTVIDSMESAVNIKLNESSHADELLNSMRDGVALTHRLLLTTLEKHGISVVDPLGEKFDPNQHQAMSMQDNKEVPSNTVVAVLQKGYCLHGRLLRPALVVIAKS
jgi:molecular chaperone GrpE